MGRLLTTRRSEWLPGVKILGAAIGMAALVGVGLGARAWTVYVGLIGAALLLLGWAERYWLRRAAQQSVRRSSRTRSRLKVIPGGKKGNGGYDLESDDSTDSQRWLM